MNAPLLLHITDTHISGIGVEMKRDDLKVSVPGIGHATREDLLDLLLSRLAERLHKDNRELDGVIFSGDAVDRGAMTGHGALRDMILSRLGPVGVTEAKIVATPGNHDVPMGTQPSSKERYEDFLSTWRDAGCITPWLDGIDDPVNIKMERHRLVGEGNAWVVYPVNSANWSHARATLQAPLAGLWEQIKTLLKSADPKEMEKLQKQLDDLIRYDMARVSEEQLEVLRRVASDTPVPLVGQQLRIATIHHHLRTPSHREELKPFADFTNLELIRTAFAERGISVVVHGHKHKQAAQTELVYDADGGNARRMLVISGASFGAGDESDALQTIELGGLPWVPTVGMIRYGLLRGGTDLRCESSKPISLWRPIDAGAGSAVVHGSDLDEVYERACELAQGDARGANLIVDLDLDLPPTAKAEIPHDYPAPESLEGAERKRWFDELAGWWQARYSLLEPRVPYHHGSRLHRFAGKFDQVARVAKMLEKKRSSRALAVLIDPMRDFTIDGNDAENFASFCLVQFRRRERPGELPAVDVIGYYRAQEFRRWWPINVCELRALQLAVCGSKLLVPGRITTVTAEARSSGRTPTQVSVPVIDRWLDQHPARLFLLATYFSESNVETSAETRAIVVGAWMQSLEDFEQSTQEFNPDGVPLAIEGIETLACYIEALEPTDDLSALLASLKALAIANRSYADTEQEVKQFGLWSASATPIIGNLRTLSVRLLQKKASTKDDEKMRDGV